MNARLNALADRYLQRAADLLVAPLFWGLGRADSTVTHFANATHLPLPSEETK